LLQGALDLLQDRIDGFLGLHLTQTRCFCNAACNFDFSHSPASFYLQTFALSFIFAVLIADLGVEHNAARGDSQELPLEFSPRLSEIDIGGVEEGQRELWLADHFF
jgi:hypothetical protein